MSSQYLQVSSWCSTCCVHSTLTDSLSFHIPPQRARHDGCINVPPEVILLMAACVYFAVIASKTVTFETLSALPHSEFVASRSKVELVLLPVTVVITALIIVGFYGILKPDVQFLRISQAFAVIGLLISVILAFSGAFIFFMGIFIEVLRILLICFLIIELEKANRGTVWCALRVTSTSPYSP